MLYATCDNCPDKLTTITYRPEIKNYTCDKCQTLYYSTQELEENKMPHAFQDIELNLHNESDVRISRYAHEDGGTIFCLQWGQDGFSEETTEYYPTLALALIRVAALSHAIQTDEMFVHEPLRFSTNANRFLNGEVGQC